jgi:hypothetical protein
MNAINEYMKGKALKGYNAWLECSEFDKEWNTVYPNANKSIQAYINESLKVCVNAYDMNGDDVNKSNYYYYQAQIEILTIVINEGDHMNTLQDGQFKTFEDNKSNLVTIMRKGLLYVALHNEVEYKEHSINEIINKVNHMNTLDTCTTQQVKQYVSDKVYGFRFDAVITRFKTITYKSGIEAGRFICIDIKGHCFYIHEEGRHMHSIVECDRIEAEDVKTFVKAWKAEHAATVKLNELHERLHMANICDKPTKQIQNSIVTWQAKQDKALDVVCEGITKGVYPVNTVALIGDELGILCGYIGDCFAGIYDDFKGAL